ncbi:MAG: restriction endonuclease subunit S [Anaerolineae bacterium]
MIKYPAVSLGDLLTLERRPIEVAADKQYAEIGVYSFGRGIFHKEPRSGLQVGDKDLYLIKKGDFIFQITFAWEGAVGLASESEDGMYSSVRFPTYRVDETRCDPRYLVNYFRTREGRDQLIRISPGSAGRNRVLSLKRIPEIYIPLPPLAEQQRIVARIDALAARIEEARGLRRQAAAEVEALLAASSHHLFNEQSWNRVSLDDLVGRANLRNGRSLRAVEQESDFRCLRISSMRNGRIDLRDTKPIMISASDAEPFLVAQRDVFVVRGNGSHELVGRAGAVEQEAKGVIFPDLFIRVPLDTTRILPSFFVAWWNSAEMRKLIVATAKTTSGIWKINQGHMASFPIPFPPLPEQRRIVAYLDDLQARVDAVKRLQAETQAELDALLPAVLDKAFKGGL